jgi:hypothetical protein
MWRTLIWLHTLFTSFSSSSPPLLPRCLGAPLGGICVEAQQRQCRRRVREDAHRTHALTHVRDARVHALAAEATARAGSVVLNVYDCTGEMGVCDAVRKQHNAVMQARIG